MKPEKKSDKLDESLHFDESFWDVKSEFLDQNVNFDEDSVISKVDDDKTEVDILSVFFESGVDKPSTKIVTDHSKISGKSSVIGNFSDILKASKTREERKSVYESIVSHILKEKSYSQDVHDSIIGEFDSLFESFEAVDGIQDEDLYESYFAKMVDDAVKRKSLELPAMKADATEVMPVAKRPTPFARMRNTINLKILPIHRNSPQQSGIVFYIFSFVIIAATVAIISGHMFYNKSDIDTTNSNNNIASNSTVKQNTPEKTKQTVPENIPEYQPQETPKKETVTEQQPEIQETSSNNVEIDQNLSTVEIERKLLKLSMKKSFGKGDFEQLKALFAQHQTNQNLCSLILHCIFQTKHEDIPSWLNSTLLNSEVEQQITVLRTVQETDFAAAKDSVKTLLQRSLREDLQIISANVLSLIAPDDQKVYDLIVEKYFIAQRMELKLRFIEVLSQMEVKTQNQFFMQILQDRTNAEAVRIAALDAMQQNLENNAKQYLPDLRLLESTEDGYIQKKLKRIIRMLQR